MIKKMLGWLFVSYRQPGSLTWASRWMHKHGRLFIGDPASVFQARGIHPELIKSYYFTKDDRHIGAAKDLTKWRFDSMFVNAYRRYEERYVALGATFVSMALCALILASVLPVYAYKEGLSAVSGFGCAGYIKDINAGEIAIEDVDQDRLAKCLDKQKKAGGGK